MKKEIICFKFNCSGLPLCNASILLLKEVCNKVCLNSLLRIIFSSISFFNSITTLIPLRSDSSLISEIPSIVLLFTVSAIFSISADFLIWYGISSMIIALRSFLNISTEVLDLKIQPPLPDRKASLIPFFHRHDKQLNYIF